MAHFISDAELQKYADMVVACLVKYGGLNESDARALVDELPIIFKPETQYERLLTFHEVPYYWAMELLFGKTNPSWYHDPKLWPPPHPNEYWPPAAK